MMTFNQFSEHFEAFAHVRGLSLTDDENDPTVAAWWAAFQDLEEPVFRAGLERMHADSDYPTIGRVRAHCADIVQAKLAATPQPEPPTDLSAAQYTAWLRTWQRHILKGAPAGEAEKRALEASNRPALSPGREPGEPLEGSVL